MGAMSFGRWHPAHRAKKIGATSLVNVGVEAAASGRVNSAILR